MASKIFSKEKTLFICLISSLGRMVLAAKAIRSLSHGYTNDKIHIAMNKVFSLIHKRSA